MTRRLFVLLLLVPMAAQADERILGFHSDVRVQVDGSIVVTETIRVRAEGNRIKRGIYRDQYNRYEDQFGNDYIARIEPLSVRRDDTAEAWHVRDIDRGIRVYFGRGGYLLPTGVYTYQYRYRASRMLGFFDDHDELYWTVTGFDWAFPIDKATASVTFDFDVAPGDITHEAYTGSFGAQGRDYTSRVDADGVVHFEANKPLSPVSGLTIVVGWPKGPVVEATIWQKIGWLLKDNRNVLAALVGFGFLLLYYVPVWRSHGKDPAEGVIFARYEPPEDFSPASLRYINQMYYDDKVMTAAVVNLAVNGHLRIEHYADLHTLVKTKAPSDAPPMAPGEAELYAELFADGDRIDLDQENHQVLGKAKIAHNKSLKDDYKNHYFQTNGYLNLPGIAIVILATILSVNIGKGATFFVIATIVLMIVTMVFFAIILRRPTLRGRKLLDEMLGFRDYLEVAEKEELNLRNPPEKTPGLFEQMLPFALALGVDQAWSEKFASVLARVRGPDGADYQPGWYSGAWSTSSLMSTSDSFSSGLSSAISSSVTPPGSSSGGGGGGFSGGGGGGGGGGGW